MERLGYLRRFDGLQGSLMANGSFPARVVEDSLQERGGSMSGWVPDRDEPRGEQISENSPRASEQDRAGEAEAVRKGTGSRRPIPPKLYRIGEVVNYSGMSRQTVHNYTTMGLLRESRWSDGGHRLYDESVFARLDAIAELKAKHMSLQDIREHFARMDKD